MTYLPPYKQPDFVQSVPDGEGWEIIPAEAGVMGHCRWRNRVTGQTVTCPYVWYTSPAKSYAKTLEFNAARSDENAERKDSERKPWSAREAEYCRQQARRLRAMATLCWRSPDIPAGHIDFMGLDNPVTPKDREIFLVSEIEARRL